MNTSTPFSHPARVFAVALIAGALCAVSASAQTITVSGSLHANTLRTDFAPLTGSPIVSYPWQNVATGSGTASNISGFSSLADAITTEAARLTYSFTSLTLTTYNGGGPGLSQEIYTPSLGSTFEFKYDGATLATASVLSLEVITNYSTGAATGSGFVELTAPGADAGFYNEIGALTGGSHRMLFTIYSFDAIDANGNFNSFGTFTASAVPEPSTWAALAGLAAFGFAGWRRQFSRSTAPVPVPAQNA